MMPFLSFALALFATTLLSAQQPIWEHWNAGLGDGPLLVLGEKIYGTGAWNVGSGKTPYATVVDYGLLPSDSSVEVRTDIHYRLIGLFHDGGEGVLGLSVSGDLYRIDLRDGSAQVVGESPFAGSSWLVHPPSVGTHSGLIAYVTHQQAKVWSVVLIDPSLSSPSYRLVSFFESRHGFEAEIEGLHALSNGNIAALYRTRTEYISEFSGYALDTVAVGVVDADGEKIGLTPVSVPGYRLHDLVDINNLPNGDFLISIRATLSDEPASNSIIHVRLTDQGELVDEPVIWKVNLGITDMIVTGSEEIIGVGVRDRGNFGTSAALFRGSLAGGITWSRDDPDFIFGLAKLNRILPWGDHNIIISGTTYYQDSTGKFYDSYLAQFSLDALSGVEEELGGADRLDLE